LEKDRESLIETYFDNFTTYKAAMLNECEQYQPLVSVAISIRNRCMEMSKPNNMQLDHEVIHQGNLAMYGGCALGDALLYCAERVDIPRTDIGAYVKMYGFTPVSILQCKSKKIIDLLNWRARINSITHLGHDTGDFSNLTAPFHSSRGVLLSTLGDTLESEWGEGLHQTMMRLYRELEYAYEQAPT
jgi:hypothetical protein